MKKTKIERLDEKISALEESIKEKTEAIRALKEERLEAERAEIIKVVQKSKYTLVELEEALKIYRADNPITESAEVNIEEKESIVDDNATKEIVK